MSMNPPPPPPGGTPPPPYGGSQYGSAQPPQRPLEHPDGTKILVLGILGLVCCSLLAPAAWVMGHRVRKEISASRYTYNNTGLVTAGWVLGIIGTGLLAISAIWVLAVVSSS